MRRFPRFPSTLIIGVVLGVLTLGAWPCASLFAQAPNRGAVPVVVEQDPRSAVGTEEKRTALVIGNSEYESAPLVNPVHDAEDMAKALEAIGFDVLLRVNANQKVMEETIRDFGRRLTQGGVGLFFFAGHGMEVKGRNYLIPTAASINSENDVKYKAVDTGLVLDEMEHANNPFNIVILDACRNNPFARSFRSSTRGLARMDAPTGTYLAYSTAPGSVAIDGDGRNGIFTKHLLAEMNASNLTIEQYFKQVRIAVAKETQKEQVPWDSSSLMGDFYFTKTEAKQAPPSADEDGQDIPGAQPSKGNGSEIATRNNDGEQKRIAEENEKLKQEQARLEREWLSLENEKRIAEERRVLAEDQEKLRLEQAKLEMERLRLEGEKANEEQRKKLAEEQEKLRQENTRLETERLRLDQEKRDSEENRMITRATPSGKEAEPTPSSPEAPSTQDKKTDGKRDRIASIPPPPPRSLRDGSAKGAASKRLSQKDNSEIITKLIKLRIRKIALFYDKSYDELDVQYFINSCGKAGIKLINDCAFNQYTNFHPELAQVKKDFGEKGTPRRPNSALVFVSESENTLKDFAERVHVLKLTAYPLIVLGQGQVQIRVVQ